MSMFLSYCAAAGIMSKEKDTEKTNQKFNYLFGGLSYGYVIVAAQCSFISRFLLYVFSFRFVCRNYVFGFVHSIFL